MTDLRTSTLAALDGFFAAVRRKADEDPDFAAVLAKELCIPIEVVVAEPADVRKKILFLDPVVVVGQGIDKFREVFAKLTDPQKRQVIKHYNLADPETLKGKGSPKGEALFDILWEGALARRQKLVR